MPKGQIPWNKGLTKDNNETLKRISEIKKGKLTYIPSKETKEKIRQFNLGKKHTEETKLKMSKNNGRYWSGKQRPDIANINHYNWNGGKSFEPYTVDWTATLKRSIRERDHYICQLCFKEQINRLHTVHHIDYNKENCNPNNLITLCAGCNGKVNFKREYWTQYFTNKIKEILNKIN